MNQTEMVGFRRMRSICQFTFQGLPLGMMMVRLVTYLRAYDYYEFDITSTGFMFTLVLILVHGVLEFALLHLDKMDNNTDFLHQCIARFNGGFGFVPSYTVKGELSGAKLSEELPNGFNKRLQLYLLNNWLLKA